MLGGAGDVGLAQQMVHSDQRFIRVTRVTRVIRHEARS